MATKLGIYNLVLTELGERRLSALNDDNENRRKIDAVYDQKLEETETSGPEKGWRFLRKRNVAVDRESATIVAISDYNSTVTGMTKFKTKTPHNLVTGNDIEIDGTTNYDADYSEVVVLSATEFYCDVDYIADDATGSVYWASDSFRYRYKIPSETRRVTKVCVSGLELTDWFEEDGYIFTNQEDETIYLNYLKKATEPGIYPSYFTKVFVLSMAYDLCYPLTKSSAHMERIGNKLEKATYRAIALDEQKQYVEEESNSWAEAGR
jgi:hypothetical protein